MLLRPIRMLLVYDAVKASCCPHFFFITKKKRLKEGAIKVASLLGHDHCCPHFCCQLIILVELYIKVVFMFFAFDPCACCFLSRLDSCLSS